MNPHGGAVAVGFVQLLASMLSGLLIDTVGRIPLLIISTVFMSLAFACLGSYIYYEQGAKLAATNAMDFEALSEASYNDWIPLLCVLIFMVAFSLGEFWCLSFNYCSSINKFSFFLRNFTNFVALGWGTVSAGVPGHGQFDCDQFQLLLLVPLSEDVCGLSGMKVWRSSLSAEPN